MNNHKPCEISTTSLSEARFARSTSWRITNFDGPIYWLITESLSPVCFDYRGHICFRSAYNDNL